MNHPTPCESERSDMTLARICEDSGQSAWIPVETPLAQAVHHLEHQPELIGLMIKDEQGYLGPLFRVKLFHALAQPYVRDLYMARSVRHFLKYHLESQPCEISTDLTINQAIEAALGRDASVRYDPLIATHPSGQRELIDVRTLINHQRCLLQNAISEVEQQRREARHAAMHDRLTGLPNRLYVMEHLQRMAGRCMQTRETFAVLFLDFDRFKLVNDSLGHDAGDALLVKISQRLRDTIEHFTHQPDDHGKWMAARLGGDEFLVVLDRVTDEHEPTNLAQTLVDTMQPSYAIDGFEVCSTPSIGVTASTISKPDPTKMVRDADAAMYRAKSEGRSRFILFDRSMHAQSMQRLRLEHDLRHALDHDQLLMYYQPIVSCHTGQIVGFEALMRWQHPSLGMVPPGVFIEIAEDSGLITPLGQFALESSLTQLAQWRSQFPDNASLYMSVNLSKKQLLHPDTLDHLKATLSQHDLPAWAVNLEVTETITVDRSQAVVPLLQAIRNLGFRLSMDDFGTGTSSLTSLHKLPIDVLKIDRGFIEQLEQNIAYTAVIQAIVTLARNLNMTITVEGVERAEQLSQVQALDCDCVQGYLFSKPVPAEQAHHLLVTGVSIAPAECAA